MKSTNAKRFLNTLVLVALIPAFRNFANAQASLQVEKQRPTVLVGSAKIRHSRARRQHPSATSDQTSKANNNADLKLSASQKSLLEGSKKAILKTGMSEPYFNEHFRLVQVVDKPGDRRVVWRFSINEYEATVIDSIGYYTEGPKRIDIHGVESILSSTADIKRTIPRTRALRIMRSCLGKFANPVVEYKADSSRRAVLVLNAHTVPKPEPPGRTETRGSKAEKALEKPTGEAEHDVIREGKKKRPPIFLGSVNLETGKCVKGIGQAGAPKPL